MNFAKIERAFYLIQSRGKTRDVLRLIVEDLEKKELIGEYRIQLLGKELFIDATLLRELLNKQGRLIEEALEDLGAEVF